MSTRIDLHTHSTASDGTLTPAELVHAAGAAGLDVVAITDHDTTAGWEPAVRALPAGLRLVRGAELSCRWYGEDPAVPLHLLAYLFDPDAPDLAAELSRVRHARTVRGERTVRLLQADGIEVSWSEILAGARGGTVGRPHIAQALIRAGLAGLEADHEDHSPAERAHVRGLAGELDLLVTGSSDFHGAHKTVRLGAFTTEVTAYERIVAAGVTSVASG